MNKKPPKDVDFGFRHLVGPLLLVFASIPFGCGVLTSGSKAGFGGGFVFGSCMLAFALVFTFAMMMRRR